MGTTSTSGWAGLWFFLGFTTLGTIPIGGGALAALAGIAMLVGSAALYKAARAKEEI